MNEDVKYYKTMVGQGIRIIRQRKKVTQKELAHKLGVSRQAICMWESEKRELKMSMLNKIAKILSVSINEILSLQRIGNVKNKKKEGKMIMKGKEKKINFELRAPQAKKVALAGNFNSWKETKLLLKKNDSGLWKIEVDLKPGRYEYKFVVDGQWITDPANANTAINAYGSANSIKEVIC